MTNKQKNHQPKSTTKSLALALGMMSIIGAGLVTSSVISSSTAFAHSEQQVEKVQKDKKHRAHKKENRAHKKARHSRPTAAQIEKRTARIINRISTDLEANDVQREKIGNLVTTFAEDVRPMRRHLRKIQKEIKQLLLEDTVNRDKVEELRQKRLAEIDRVSSKVTLAMVEAAEVLNSDQRHQLNEKLEDMRKKKWRRR